MSNKKSIYLLINPISDPAVYILSDAKRNIVAHTELVLRGSESERFFDSIGSFLSEYEIGIPDLDGIVVVNGPGGFTSMRIVTLAINTVAFVHHIPLYSIDFFGLLECAGGSFPMLLKANRGEYLVRMSHDHSMELVAVWGVAEGSYTGIGDENDFENRRISIQSSLDYDRIIRSLDLSIGTDRIEPIYIKKPNIIIKSL